MRKYIRKIFKHDITHEISITTKIVKDFFNSEKSFIVKGLNSEDEGEVVINSATDPRFGGDIKRIIRSEGGIDIDDLIIFHESGSNRYELEIVKKTNDNYHVLSNLFKKNKRHIVFEADEQHFHDDYLEYIAKYLKSKLDMFSDVEKNNYENIVQKHEDLRKRFLDKFSIENLKNMDSETKNKKLFTTGAINDSLLYNLASNEFKNLGSIGQSTSTPIDYRVDLFVNDLEKIATFIEEEYNFSYETFSKLINLIKSLNEDYLVRLWFFKYLYINFPHVFVSQYDSNTKKVLLNKLHLLESNDDFINMYNLSKIATISNIPTYMFEFVLNSAERLNNNAVYDETMIKEIITKPHQRIFFGAPGTGKSYNLSIEAQKYFGDNYERVTMHPNYTYGNFVGSFKPFPKAKENGEEYITYKYVPGPLMKMFLKVMLNPDKNYLLIIEEINRANVSAIFGDFFQLLDRKDGISEYPIVASEDVKLFLRERLSRAECSSEVKNRIQSMLGIDYERIVLPSNLYIWATMNSADQGVMPMDTAFKRRWDFEYIGINDAYNNNIYDFDNYKFKISNNQIVKWNDFRVAINNILSSVNVPEDKLIGPYFISKSILDRKDIDELTDNVKNKVLMYLYEDAGKANRSKIFDIDKAHTFSELCKSFSENGNSIFKNDLEIESFEIRDFNDEQLYPFDENIPVDVEKENFSY